MSAFGCKHFNHDCSGCEAQKGIGYKNMYCSVVWKNIACEHMEAKDDKRKRPEGNVSDLWE